MKVFAIFALILLGIQVYSQSIKIDSSFSSDGVYINTAVGEPVQIFNTCTIVDSTFNLYTSYSHLVNDISTWGIVKLSEDGEEQLECNFKWEADGLDPFIEDIVLTPDNSILACGIRNNALNPEILEYIVHKINSDCNLDKTFGDQGTISGYEFDGSMLERIFVNSDSTFIISYKSTDYTTFKTYISIKQFKLDGTVDSNFGNNGKFTIPSWDEMFINSFRYTPFGDDILIAVAMENEVENTVVQVYKLENKGKDLQEFDAVVFPTLTEIGALVTNNNGELFIGGGTLYPDDFFRPFIFKILSSGELDDDFNENMFISNPELIGTSTGEILLYDNKILLLLGGDEDHSSIINIQEDGQINPDFGSLGIHSLNEISNIYDYAFRMRFDKNHRIIVSGFYVGNETGIQNYGFTARYLFEKSNSIIKDQHDRFINFYPSPTKDIISANIDLMDDRSVITVYDYAGKQVFKGWVSSLKSGIYVSNWLPGTYIVHIDGRPVGKFVKI